MDNGGLLLLFLVFFLLRQWRENRPTFENISAKLRREASELAARKDFAAAEERLSQLVRMTEQRSGPNSIEVIPQLRKLAMMKFQQGDYVSAESLFQQVLAIQEINLPANSPDQISTLESLANISRIQGNFDPAIMRLRRVLAIRAAIHGEDS